MSEQKPKIFLSYAHVDLGYAKKIYDDLKRYGLEVWFDKESLLPGQDWEKKIRKSIRESDFFIALLSDKCLSKRGFVHSELKFSFEIVEKYFPADTGIFVIPVRLDDCKPSDAYERLGKLHWIDVFPESEYQNGLRKILKVVSPGTFIIRSKQRVLSSSDVNEMLKTHGYYDRDRNPDAKGIEHDYQLKEIKGYEFVFDKTTKLMWQQGGSPEYTYFEHAMNWIIEINQKGFAGFNDWRLPTLEEAMSLMEPEKKDLYIDPIFNSYESWIWTVDQAQGESAQWVVYFDKGNCGNYFPMYNYYVRAVRSAQ